VVERRGPPTKGPPRFADTGPIVALHLLRRAGTGGRGKRMRSAELVRVVLEGTGGPGRRRPNWGWRTSSTRVIAIDAAGSDEVDAEGVRLALWETSDQGALVVDPPVADLHGVPLRGGPRPAWQRRLDGPS